MRDAISRNLLSVRTRPCRAPNNRNRRDHLPAVSFVDGLSVHSLSHPPQIVRITNAVVDDDCLGRSRQPVFECQTGFFLLILCGLRIGSQMHEEVRVRGRIEVAERCNDVGKSQTRIVGMHLEAAGKLAAGRFVHRDRCVSAACAKGDVFGGFKIGVGDGDARGPGFVIEWRIEKNAPRFRLGQPIFSLL